MTVNNCCTVYIKIQVGSSATRKMEQIVRSTLATKRNQIGHNTNATRPGQVAFDCKTNRATFVWNKQIEMCNGNKQIDADERTNKSLRDMKGTENKVRTGRVTEVVRRIERMASGAMPPQCYILPRYDVSGSGTNATQHTGAHQQTIEINWDVTGSLERQTGSEGRKEGQSWSWLPTWTRAGKWTTCLAASYDHSCWTR